MKNIQICTIVLSLILTVFMAYYAQYLSHNILYKMLRGRLKDIGFEGIKLVGYTCNYMYL